MQVAIVDYGAGNVQSVQFALERLGVREIQMSDRPEVLQKADKVIFPGQGAAGAAMVKLKDSALGEVIASLTQPVLGICLGMQLFCSFSEEGDTRGLGLFPMKVQRFPESVKHPQMGWNSIRELKGPLFKGLNAGAYMYLVHSFYVPLSEWSTATAEYGLAYSVAIQQDNFYGVQFHPEKSGPAGQQVLQNFIQL